MKQKIEVLAPAKISLFLHVTGQEQDGHYLIDSLVGFTDIGDILRFDYNNRFLLTVDGPYKSTLGSAERNMIVRAAELFSEATGKPLQVSIHLTKNLPVSSGVGGAASDAAACLKGLAKLWEIDDDLLLTEICQMLGADISVCLEEKPALIQGIGNRVQVINDLCTLPIVLASPLVKTPSISVFQKYQANHPEYSEQMSAHDIPRQHKQIIPFLKMTGNDLAEPAIECTSDIEEVLKDLRETEECEFAQISGTGATCFGVYPDMNAALKAETKLKRLHPGWWVQSGKIWGRKR